MRRYWMFTINRPVVSADDVCTKLTLLCDYYVFQREEGEEETEHFQGFLKLKKKNRMEWLKRHFNERAHYDPRPRERPNAFNINACADYCKKPEGRIAGPWEHGVIPKGSGERTDLKRACTLLLESEEMDCLLENDAHLYVKYHKGFEKLVELAKKPEQVRTSPKEVFLLWGNTGLGKTRAAYYEDRYLYKLPISNNTWFNGYRRQKTILMDDFKGEMKLVHLLQFLDPWYNVQVPVKGGFVWLDKIETIIITTNVHPKKWYKWEGRENQYDALLRRIMYRIVFHDDGTIEYLDKDENF